MNYRQTIEFLYDQLPVFHRIGPAAYKPDIGNIESLCAMLGEPHKKFRSIHIAGTNGKGSVSHMLASILQSAGYCTGLHTSPHLKDYRERFRINGKMILKSEVVDFVKSWKNEFESLKPSFFEMSVALAFDHFAKKQVDVAVIETGMGGRLDSTNILSPEISVITTIGWDHMMFLGNTLEKIAQEKAGIIKPGIPVVVGETHPETEHVFISKATELDLPYYFADQELRVEKTKPALTSGSHYRVYRDDEIVFKDLYCPLGGDYQAPNLVTVLKVLDVLRNQNFHITPEAVANGIAKVTQNTGLKGRWQVLGRNPLIIADVGHNKDGIRFIIKQISTLEFRKLHFVLGMVNDKDVAGILTMLPASAIYYFCKPDIPRGLDASLLASEADKIGLKGDIYASVGKAFHAAKTKAGKEDLVFVGGSSFVVAEVV
ncbi:MAG: bifunctional folylpolyglutamate synthase/dihydrofolate synthase [Bacteroidales bacterium]|nr:bifunctional folylpolyglutamate synthase/dihydrofolate synthase [Bacteroidales bacterium]